MKILGIEINTSKEYLLHVVLILVAIVLVLYFNGIIIYKSYLLLIEIFLVFIIADSILENWLGL